MYPSIYRYVYLVILLSFYLHIMLHESLSLWPQRLCAAIHFVTLATKIDQSSHGNIYINLLLNMYVSIYL